MNFLKRMLTHPDLIKLQGTEISLPYGNSRITQQTKEEFLVLIKEARYFVIDSDINTEDGIGKVTDRTGISDLILSMPFKVCWFEIAPSSSGTYQPLGFNQYEEDIWVAPVGMLVNEIGPNRYDIYTFDYNSIKQAKVNTSEAFDLFVFKNLNYNESERPPINRPSDFLRTPSAPSLADIQYSLASRYRIGYSTLDILKVWLSNMRRETVVTEKVNEPLRIPRPMSDYAYISHKIQTIIRIVPTKTKANIGPITKGGVIDWSHRWEVRGHWRKIDGIGKDREGDYSMNGFTWVKEHIKGPEESELIKKVRLIS